MQKYVNTRIQKLSNDSRNAQQMVVQLTTYLMFFLPLYHSSQAIQFINIPPFEECASVLKSQITLNELELDSINIMYS